MRTFQRLFAAFVLTLMLALSAFAGQIDTGIVSPPPPPQLATAGEIQTGKAGEITTMVTASLNLITSVLSLI